jgi:hypothetical protein
MPIEPIAGTPGQVDLGKSGSDPASTSNAGAAGTVGVTSPAIRVPVSPVPIVPATGSAGQFDPGQTGSDSASNNDTGAIGVTAPVIVRGPVSEVPIVPIAGSAGQIDLGNLLGSFDQGSIWKFLQSEGTATGESASGALGGSGTTIVVQTGGPFTERFNLASGDKLDLTQVLAGAPISQDLTNLGQFVKVVGYGVNDPGYGQGTKTMLEITGPGGSARIDLQGSGRLDLKDLLHHDSLLLPPN